MGSKRFGEALFQAHSGDHDPRHIHASIGGHEVLLELGYDGKVRIANRRDALRGVTKTEARRALRLANDHFDELVTLWEKAAPK